MLEYYREYRNLYYMGGIDYGVSEGQASRIERDVESVLINPGNFHYPGREVLYEGDSGVEVFNSRMATRRVPYTTDP